MMTLRLMCILSATLLTSSLHGQEHASLAPSNQVLDILYYPTNQTGMTPYQQELCRLDVYMPMRTNDSPVVIWFHGGGLTGGSKRVPAGLKNAGVIVVAANYRLSPQVKCPVYLEDAAAAVAWTFKHIAEYGGRQDRIFVAGHSAGGYLATMLVFDKNWLASHDLDANRIVGVIPFSGQCITHFAIRKEKGIEINQPVVDEFAPLFHVRADAPPVLLLTGDREKEVAGRYEENAYFMRMLKVSGHTNVTLCELQGYGHSMVDPGTPLLLRFIQSTLAARQKT